MRNRLVGPLRRLGEQYLPDRAKETLRKAIARSLEHRVVTYEELAERETTRTWEYDESRTVTFREPAYYNELPDSVRGLIGDHECHRPVVHETPSIELIGTRGIKRTADGEFLVFNFRRDRTPDAAKFLSYDVLETVADGTNPFGRAGADVPEFDLAVPLLGRWATNYSHWTEEYLAQLEGVRHYVEQTGETPTILIPPDPPAFISESLEHLGFAPDDYQELPAARVRLERAVLPSVRNCWSTALDGYMRMPSGVRWVRDAVMATVPQPEDGAYPSRILVSREQDAEERRIVNWEAVESALSERGFQTVTMSGMEFREQKRLFAGADVIVGTHGAGLTELIYADDATILELFGDYYVPTYFELAQFVGVTYGCLHCEDEGSDLIVDVPELLDALDTLAAA